MMQEIVLKSFMPPVPPASITCLLAGWRETLFSALLRSVGPSIYDEFVSRFNGVVSLSKELN